MGVMGAISIIHCGEEHVHKSFGHLFQRQAACHEISAERLPKEDPAKRAFHFNECDMTLTFVNMVHCRFLI